MLTEYYDLLDVSSWHKNGKPTQISIIIVLLRISICSAAAAAKSSRDFWETSKNGRHFRENPKLSSNKAEILLPSGGARGFEPNNLKPSSSVKLKMLNSKLSLINRVMMTRMTDDLGDDRVDAEDDSNEF